MDPLAEKYPSWSSFTYTLNNPILLTDPTGMEGESIHEDGYGNVIAEYDDGDNNVYVHSDLGDDGQHIDGMKASVDRRRENYGTSRGGKKSVFKSMMNKLSIFFEGGGVGFQNTGMVLTGPNDVLMGETLPENCPESMVPIDDMLKMLSGLNSFPKNVIFNRAANSGSNIVEGLGRLAEGMDKISSGKTHGDNLAEIIKNRPEIITDTTISTEKVKLSNGTTQTVVTRGKKENYK